MTRDDINDLVSLVGRSGAIHALTRSDKISANDLRELARALGLATSKQSKYRLSNLIVRKIDRRILKPLDELESLSQDELHAYLSSTDCDVDELNELLAKADIPIQGRMSRTSLLQFAAIQISNLGMFKRISSSDCSGRRTSR